MIIEGGGNVGIGTTSPNAKLEVASGQAKTATSGVEFARFGTSNEASNYATLTCEVKGGAAASDRKWIFQTIESGVANAGNIIFQPSGGSVGIGTDSPSANLEVESSSNPEISIASTAGATSNYLNFKATSHSQPIQSQIKAEDNGDFTADMVFSFKGTGTSGALAEKMRITSGGLSKFKTQAGSYGYGSGYNFHEFNNDFGNQPIAMFWQASGSGSHYGINVHNNDDENDTTSRFFMGKGGSTERIKIYSNGNIENTNNSYGQLSDIKLKENVTDATSKLEDLMKVQIKNFNYIGQEQKQIGVIAQELEQIFPNLIYETPKTKREEVNKTDNEGNIIYQTEKKLINEAVEGQDAIEWNEKPTQDNTKIEIQTWLDNNNIEWQSADTKQELLDRIPEYQQEAVEAKEAIYETIETDEPVKENVELATGEVIKGVKYSVFVPMLIKGMQEQQQLINDLKSRIETLENN
jgi:hypothetical protein